MGVKIGVPERYSCRGGGDVVLITGILNVSYEHKYPTLAVVQRLLLVNMYVLYHVFVW